MHPGFAFRSSLAGGLDFRAGGNSPPSVERRQGTQHPDVIDKTEHFEFALKSFECFHD
jgi:hypothetical protein